MVGQDMSEDNITKHMLSSGPKWDSLVGCIQCVVKEKEEKEIYLEEYRMTRVCTRSYDLRFQLRTPCQK